MKRVAAGILVATLGVIGTGGTAFASKHHTHHHCGSGGSTVSGTTGGGGGGGGVSITFATTC